LLVGRIVSVLGILAGVEGRHRMWSRSYLRGGPGLVGYALPLQGEGEAQYDKGDVRNGTVRPLTPP
jgi:hypothetical protein